MENQIIDSLINLTDWQTAHIPLKTVVEYFDLSEKMGCSLDNFRLSNRPLGEIQEISGPGDLKIEYITQVSLFDDTYEGTLCIGVAENRFIVCDFEM